MTRLSALLATSTLLLSVAAADDAPLLAIPGEALFQSAFDAPLGDSWKAAKGEWIIADGSLKGSELEADKHGAVNRYTTQLTDFIIEAEFKLDGARAISLSINAVKDHMARIAITPAPS